MFKIKAMIPNTLRVFAYGDRQSFAFPDYSPRLKAGGSIT